MILYDFHYDETRLSRFQVLGLKDPPHQGCSQDFPVGGEVCASHVFKGCHSALEAPKKFFMV